MYLTVSRASLAEKRRRRVRLALRLLQAAAPMYFLHICRENLLFIYDPRVCPEALACTGHAGRRVFLTVDPLHLEIPVLAALLAHEARHHRTSADGRHFIVKHTCTNCRDPRERRHDAIYVEHERLERYLRVWVRGFRQFAG